MVRAVRLSILLLTIAASVPVSAQEPGEAERLFREANEAYRAERFPAARALLQSSLRAEGSISAAYNLAAVEQSMGLPMEAEVTLRRLLDDEYGPPTSEQRQAARALRDEVYAEQSTIMVTLRGGDGTLMIDGDAVAELVDGTEHVRRVNPGQRRVAAVGQRGTRAGAEVSALPGRDFEVELFLLEGRGTTSEQGSDASEDAPSSRRGLRIGLTLGALLLVGAAVAVSVVVLRPQPYEDDVFPTAMALRFGP